MTGERGAAPRYGVEVVRSGVRDMPWMVRPRGTTGHNHTVQFFFRKRDAQYTANRINAALVDVGAAQAAAAQEDGDA